MKGKITEHFIQAVAVGKTFINEESLKVERENSTFYRTRESLREGQGRWVSEYSRSCPFALKEGIIELVFFPWA